MKKNRGITLIALVITIIVLLILAGVTLSLVAGENGILKRATNAVDVNERASAEEQANLLLAELAVQYYEEKYANHKEVGELDAYIKEQLTSDTPTDTGEYIVSVEGEEVIVKKDGKEISKGTLRDGKVVGWTGRADEGNTPTPPKPENPTGGKEDTSKNRTLAGTTTGYSYKNPVIPQGFSAVDEGIATWTYQDTEKTEVTGWNEGLVIRDEIGNEFVWVPVDGINVKYEKNFSYPSNFGASSSNVLDDTGACPVDNENVQITRYGGFYVARYEAGNENALTNDANSNNIGTKKPISKAEAKVWNIIDYNNAVAASKLMIDDESTYGNNKSGIITGTQWDTIMKWYSNSEIVVNSIQQWGTYYDLDYSGNGKYFTDRNLEWTEGTFTHTAITAPVVYHAAGLNSSGIKKNIADLGGNIFEWTSERYSDDGIYRGGSANCDTSSCPVSYRFKCSVTVALWHIGFRPVIYIQ